MESTPAELLKNIEKLLKETDVKMDSLSRLREALDKVEVVLDKAVTLFKKDGATNPMVLVKDIIEPQQLGILFAYVKDIRLTESLGFLQKKQQETVRELSVLDKRKQRLQICQSSILQNQEQHDNLKIREPTNLPIIEEHKPCNPITKLGKISRDKNGLLEMSKITEESFAHDEPKISENVISKSLTKEDDQSLEITSDPLKQGIARTNHELQGGQENVKPKAAEISKEVKLAVKAASDAAEDVPVIGSPYSGVIDLDVMEKLDGMDPEERAEYTGQFYRELLDEDDWLFPVNEEQDSEGDEEQSADRKTRRKQKVKPRSKLFGFFNKKRGDSLYGEKTQSQSSAQTQQHDNKSPRRTINKKRPVIFKKSSKGVARQRQMMDQRQPSFLQDAEGAPFKAKIVERATLGAPSNVRKEQKTKKLSKFKRRQMNLLN